MEDINKSRGQVYEHITAWNWELDHKGIFTHSGPEIKEFLNYNPRDLIHKKSYADLFPEEEAPEILDIIKARKKPACIAFRNRKITQEGVHRWFLTVISPILDTSEKLKGFRGLDIDITNQETTITDLRQSEEKYHMLAELSGDMISIYALSGKILYVSPACKELLRYETKELREKNLFNLAHPDDKEMLVTHFNKIKEGISLPPVTYRIMKKDETYTWFETVIKPIASTDSSKIERVLCGSRDVSERQTALEMMKQAKEEAEKTNHFKSQFISNMSHEIRTPMNAIVGYIGLLEEETLSSRQQEYLGIISDSSQILLQLLNNILDLSKIYSGEMEVANTPFFIQKTFEKIKHIFQVQATEKKLKFIIKIEESFPSVLTGDENKLTSILINLLSNAFKFTEKGQITLTAAYITDCLSITIQDTGIGIPDEQKSWIYHSFQQGDSSFTRKYGGSGLGLSITKKLIDILKGKIQFVSTENKGSTFSFSLPFKPTETAVLEDIFHITTDSEEESRDTIHFLNSYQLSPNDWPLYYHGLTQLNRYCEEFAEILEIKGPEEAKKMIHNILPLSDLLLQEKLSAFLRKETHALDSKNEPARWEFLQQLGLLTGPLKNAHHAEMHSFKTINKLPKGKCRILVADDSELNQTLMKRMLDRIGLTCDLASNGREVLKMVEHSNYDLLLIDLKMPIMNGIQTIQIIRSNPKWQDIFIIVISAHPLNEDHCVSGYDDFIIKPIDINLFYKKILYFTLDKKLNRLISRQTSRDETSPELTGEEKTILLKLVDLLHKNQNVFDTDELRTFSEKVKTNNSFLIKILEDVIDLSDNYNIDNIPELINTLNKVLDE